MASIVKGILAVSLIYWMSFQEVEAADDCPTLKTRNGLLNPMTLGIAYCKDAELFVSHDSKKAIELLSFEDIYKYDVTDLRSRLEYLFNRIIFVMHDDKIKKEFSFLGSSSDDQRLLMLVVHRRYTPTKTGGKETVFRYLIIGINLEKISGKGADEGAGLKALGAAITAKGNAKLKLSSLFPSHGKINRHRLSMESEKCLDNYVFIEFENSLKLSAELFDELKGYATSDWVNDRIDVQQNGTATSENGQQVRFDCKRATDPNKETNGAGEAKFYAGFAYSQVILLSMHRIFWMQ